MVELFNRGRDGLGFAARGFLPGALRLWNSQGSSSGPDCFTSQKVFTPAPDEHNLENLHGAALRSGLSAGRGWTHASGISADIAAGLIGPVSSGEYVSSIGPMLSNSRLFYAALYRHRRVHVGCQDMILAAIPDGSRFGAANVRLLGAPMTTGDKANTLNTLNTPNT